MKGWTSVQSFLLLLRQKYTDLAAGMSACMEFGEAGKLLVPATDFLMPANLGMIAKKVTNFRQDFSY